MWLLGIFITIYPFVKVIFKNDTAIRETVKRSKPALISRFRHPEKFNPVCI